MISVTPLNRNVELAAKRATIIRAAAFSVAGLTAIVVAASRLANFTGDLLSSLVLVLTAVVTLMAMAAPREARHGHG